VERFFYEKTKMDLQNLRITYSAQTLNEADVLRNPFAQLEKWLQDALAAEILEPNAMQIATVNRGGQPSVRTVLLKGLDENGLVFYTNYDSRKGQNLAENPHCALLFSWLPLERQIRIEGSAAKVARSLSETYFKSRPKSSQIGATVSPQSQAITREELEQKTQEITAQYADTDTLPLPGNWGGYCIAPTRIEFWQGRPSRLHDRICYTLQTDGTWTIERLAP
jgi:pyridoxamine 5'-phosphate oxidase